jgi:hypothetical protein
MKAPAFVRLLATLLKPIAASYQVLRARVDPRTDIRRAAGSAARDDTSGFGRHPDSDEEDEGWDRS